MSVNTSGAAHELGAGIRDLRQQRGLTNRALAELVDASSANVSNWERGERLPKEDQLVKILDALQVEDQERERLLGLRRQGEGPGELVSGVPSIHPQLIRLIEHEQVARKITDVAPLLVPGLAQTAGYARHTLTGADIEVRIALRRGRRDVILRERNPVEFHAYIDDEVLTRPVGPPEVMAEQLRYLLELAERPNVTIQLVPSTAGYSPMLAGPFILMEFATAEPMVHLEHHRASATLWGREDVNGFVEATQKIHQIAMTPARSAEVIEGLVNGMETI